MADSLEKLWSKLSLREDEQEKVTVEQEWVEETMEEGEKCIVGRVLTRRVINMEAMSSITEVGCLLLLYSWFAAAVLMLSSFSCYCFFYYYSSVAGISGFRFDDVADATFSLYSLFCSAGF